MLLSVSAYSCLCFSVLPKKQQALKTYKTCTSPFHILASESLKFNVAAVCLEMVTCAAVSHLETESAASRFLEACILFSF